MIDWKLYTKIVKVIESCENVGQILTADNFAELALKEINKKRKVLKTPRTNTPVYEDGLDLREEINRLRRIQRDKIPEY